MAASYQWAFDQVILQIQNPDNDGNVWVRPHLGPGGKTWFKLRSGAAKTMTPIIVASMLEHFGRVDFQWKDHKSEYGYIRSVHFSKVFEHSIFLGP